MTQLKFVQQQYISNKQKQYNVSTKTTSISQTGTPKDSPEASDEKGALVKLTLRNLVLRKTNNVTDKRVLVNIDARIPPEFLNPWNLGSENLSYSLFH